MHLDLGSSLNFFVPSEFVSFYLILIIWLVLWSMILVRRKISVVVFSCDGGQGSGVVDRVL